MRYPEGLLVKQGQLQAGSNTMQADDVVCAVSKPQDVPKLETNLQQQMLLAGKSSSLHCRCAKQCWCTPIKAPCWVLLTHVH